MAGFGVWRSLVARSVRVGEVPSSNLGTPIFSSHRPESGVRREGAGPGDCGENRRALELVEPIEKAGDGVVEVAQHALVVVAWE